MGNTKFGQSIWDVSEIFQWKMIGNLAQMGIRARHVSATAVKAHFRIKREAKGADLQSRLHVYHETKLTTT